MQRQHQQQQQHKRSKQHPDRAILTAPLLQNSGWRMILPNLDAMRTEYALNTYTIQITDSCMHKVVA